MKIRGPEIIITVILIGFAALLFHAYRVTRPQEEIEVPPAPPSKAPVVETPVTPAGQPRIEVPELKYDFGTIEPNQEVEHTFPIKNTGTGLLKIEGLRTSCGCVTLEAPALEITSQTAGTLIAKLNPQHYGGPSPDISAYIYTNDPNTNVTELKVMAKITPEFVLEPEMVDFGPVEKGKGSSQTLRVRQTWREPVKITSIDTSSNAIAAFYSETRAPQESGSGSGKSSYEIEVRLKPDAPGGDVRAQVMVHTNIPRMATVPIPVRAFVKGELYAVPKRFFFVARPSTKRLGSIDIYSDGPFLITEVTSGVPGVMWQSVPAGMQRAHRITGSLETGAQPGERSGSVTVKLGGVGTAQQQLVMPVAGLILEEDSQR